MTKPPCGGGSLPPDPSKHPCGGGGAPPEKYSGNPHHPRHLPQLRLPDVVYFITWRLNSRQDQLSPQERTIVQENLLHFNEQRYRLAGYVVMDDHVHVMVMPLPPWQLGQILHSWKSYTAKQINKRRGAAGTRWMKDSRTEIMRSERELRAKLQYTLDNPRRRWPEITDYPWVESFDVL